MHGVFSVVSLISEPAFIFKQFTYFLSSLSYKSICAFIPMCLFLCVCLTLLRFVEPDPSHTLEERVVHWYFAQLDNNGSHDINKKELKPFKRYLKKKAKPKKCARKFTDYCDLNKDRAISLQELKGCLGVSKEGKRIYSCTGQQLGTAKYMETPLLVDHIKGGLENRTETLSITNLCNAKKLPDWVTKQQHLVPS